MDAFWRGVYLTSWAGYSQVGVKFPTHHLGSVPPYGKLQTYIQYSRAARILIAHSDFQNNTSLRRPVHPRMERRVRWIEVGEMSEVRMVVNWLWRVLYLCCCWIVYTVSSFVNLAIVSSGGKFCYSACRMGKCNCPFSEFNPLNCPRKCQPLKFHLAGHSASWARRGRLYEKSREWIN